MKQKYRYEKHFWWLYRFPKQLIADFDALLQAVPQFYLKYFGVQANPGNTMIPLYQYLLLLFRSFSKQFY